MSNIENKTLCLNIANLEEFKQKIKNKFLNMIKIVHKTPQLLATTGAGEALPPSIFL